MYSFTVSDKPIKEENTYSGLTLDQVQDAMLKHWAESPGYLGGGPLRIKKKGFNCRFVAEDTLRDGIRLTSVMGWIFAPDGKGTIMFSGTYSTNERAAFDAINRVLNSIQLKGD